MLFSLSSPAALPSQGPSHPVLTLSPYCVSVSTGSSPMTHMASSSPPLPSHVAHMPASARTALQPLAFGSLLNISICLSHKHLKCNIFKLIVLPPWSGPPLNFLLATLLASPGIPWASAIPPSPSLLKPVCSLRPADATYDAVLPPFRLALSPYLTHDLVWTSYPKGFSYPRLSPTRIPPPLCQQTHSLPEMRPHA